MRLALCRQRANRQRILLIYSLQPISMHSVSDELKLLWQRLTAVRHADIRDIGTADVIALRTFFKIRGAQPVAFDLEAGESRRAGSSDKENTDRNKTSDHRDIWHPKGHILNLAQIWCDGDSGRFAIVGTDNLFEKCSREHLHKLAGDLKVTEAHFFLSCIEGLYNQTLWRVLSSSPNDSSDD